MPLQRILWVLAAVLSLSACVSNRPVETPYRVVNIAVAPPPPRIMVIPDPRPGYAWAPGYWAWDGSRHDWVDGRWIREEPGRHWVPDRWEKRRGRWHFKEGHWTQ
jgi:hypothetical protein